MPYGATEADAFLRHVRPDWSKAARARVWEKLQKINVNSVNDLVVMNPVRVNQELCNIGERKFTQSTLAALTGHRSFFNNIGYTALRESTGTRLPRGRDARHDSPSPRKKQATEGRRPPNEWTNKAIADFYQKLQEDEFWEKQMQTDYQKTDQRGKLSAIFHAWWALVGSSAETLDIRALAELSPIHAFREALRIQCAPLSVAARLRRMLQLDPSAPISLTLDDFVEIVYHLMIPIHEICPSVVNPRHPSDGYRALFNILAGEQVGKTLSLTELQGSADVMVNTSEGWNLNNNYLHDRGCVDRVPGWLAKSSSDTHIRATKVLKEQAETEIVRNQLRLPFNAARVGKTAIPDTSDNFSRMSLMANMKRMDHARTQKTDRSVRGYLSDMTRQRQEIMVLQGQMALATKGAAKRDNGHEGVPRRGSQDFDSHAYSPSPCRSPGRGENCDRLAKLLLEHPPDVVDASPNLRLAARSFVLPVTKRKREEVAEKDMRRTQSSTAFEDSRKAGCAGRTRHKEYHTVTFGGGRTASATTFEGTSSSSNASHPSPGGQPSSRPSQADREEKPAKAKSSALLDLAPAMRKALHQRVDVKEIDFYNG